MEPEPTYVIAGGYTAGHLTPGLALVEEFHQRHPRVRILFAGWTDPLEAAFVRQSGISFLPLPAAPWAHRTWKTRGQAVWRMLPAFRLARQQFRRAGAVGLLSLGSFAAFVPALAARSLGLPVTVFEPNVGFGLSNRLLCPLAGQVLTSKLFGAARPLPSPRYQAIGVPLRAAFKALAARQPGAPAGPLHLLVEGGSLGNPFFNERVPALARHLIALGMDLRITHQCGRAGDPAPIRVAYAQAGVPAVVEPFFNPIDPLLASAHFVLTSAGAISLHEIAAAGIPVLVSPLRDGAAAHQYANAEVFRQATGCLVRTQETWETTEVAAQIAAVLRQPDRWLQQSRALHAFADPTAGEQVLRQIVSFVPVLAR